MKIEFSGSYKNKITEDTSLMLNTITVKRRDGKVVELDRDETNYGLENGNADIEFSGTYEWNGEDADYNLNPAEYDGAEVVGYDIEEDTPEGYDLRLTIGQKIAAW